jgi:hypothetical protein
MIYLIKIEYRIAEEIRYYRQLGGLKQEQNKAIQHICMLNAFSANKQEAIMALFRLKSIGIDEEQILGVDRFLQQINNGRQHALHSTP